MKRFFLAVSLFCSCSKPKAPLQRFIEEMKQDYLFDLSNQIEYNKGAIRYDWTMTIVSTKKLKSLAKECQDIGYKFYSEGLKRDTTNNRFIRVVYFNVNTRDSILKTCDTTLVASKFFLEQDTVDL